jgi:hypothetical protein
MPLRKLVDSLQQSYNNRNVKLQQKIADIICSISLDDYIKLCENEPLAVWGCIQTFDMDQLYHDDGWYKIYKSIITKHPENIIHVTKTFGVVNEPKKHRLTQSQYDELCDIAKVFLEEKQKEKNKEEQMIDDIFEELKVELSKM